MFYVLALGIVKLIGVENVPIMLAILAPAFPLLLIGIRKEDKTVEESG